MAVHAHRPRVAGRRHGRGRQPRPTSTPPASRPPSSLPATSSPVDGPASMPSATIDGSTALVADAGLTGAAPRGIRGLDRHRMARGDRASCSPSWRSTRARSRTTVLATFDRGAYVADRRGSSSADRRDRPDPAGPRSPVSPMRSAHRPRPQMLSTSPRPTSAAPLVGRMVEVGGRRHRVRDGARRSSGCSPGRRGASCSSLLDVAWLDDPEAWNAAVADWLTERSATCSVQRLGRAEQHHQRGLDRDRRAHHRSRTTLPYPVDGHRRRRPVERPPHRRGPRRGHRRAAVAIHRAGAGRRRRRQRRGHARGLAASPTGVPVGTPSRSPPTCRPTGRASAPRSSRRSPSLVFGIGVWRNIRRRRRQRARGGRGEAAGSPSRRGRAESADAATPTESGQPGPASDGRGSRDDPTPPATDAPTATRRNPARG